MINQLIQQGWKETTLRELVESGIIERPLDGNHGNIHPKGDDFVSEGIPFVMASNLQKGKVDLKSCAFISRNQAENLKKGFARTGDILLSHKATIGRTALLKTDFEYVVLSPQVTYYRVRDKQRLSNVFLKYYFDSPDFQKVLLSFAGGGSTRDYIGITAQGALPILLPPLPEQKAIAAALSAFDDKIELLREQNKTLEEMGQTIFKEWFGKYSVERPEELPEGWRVGILKEVTSIYDSKRIPLSSVQRRERQGRYPYYGATSIMDYVDEYLFEGIYLLLAEDGSVIDQYGYPVLQYVWGNFWVNNHAHVLQGKNGFSTELLYLYFRRTKIAGIVNGAVQLKINQSNLMNFELIIADQQNLGKVNEIIQPIFDKIRDNNDLIQSLTNSRDQLLPKLMCGTVLLDY